MTHLSVLIDFISIGSIGNKVHDVGYRVFLLRKALELGVERFNAYNTKDNGVQVLISFLDGDNDQILTFNDYIRNNKPENAEVSDTIFEDYAGYVIHEFRVKSIYQ